MKDSNEEYPSKSIICHNSNKVVDGGDQWARGYGRVYTYFFEKQWDTGTYGTGDRHCHLEGDSHAAGDSKGSHPGISFEQMHIDTETK